jgi:hypothetical protein
MSSRTCKSAEANPFVRQCIEAWDKAYLAAIHDHEDDDEDDDDCDPEALAALAYREAMPPLCGVRNIRNYIACVAHGYVVGAIDIADSSKLLYAAQIAFSTRRIRPPQEKKPRPASKKEPSGASSQPRKAAQEPSAGPAHAA